MERGYFHSASCGCDECQHRRAIDAPLDGIRLRGDEPGLCVRCGTLITHISNETGVMYECRCFKDSVDRDGWFVRQQKMLREAMENLVLQKVDKPEPDDHAFPDDPTPVLIPTNRNRDLCQSCAHFDFSEAGGLCLVKERLIKTVVRQCNHYSRRTK